MTFHLQYKQPFFLGHFTIPKNVKICHPNRAVALLFPRDRNVGYWCFDMLVEDKVTRFLQIIWEEKGSQKKDTKKVKFCPKSLRNSKWLHPSMRPIPDRLEKDNPHVKLKCLKIIKHVSWHISKLVSVGRMEKHMSERDWRLCPQYMRTLFNLFSRSEKPGRKVFMRGAAKIGKPLLKKCYLILNCCVIPIPHDPIASTNSYIMETLKI